MSSPAALLHKLPRLKYLMVGAFCALLNLVLQNGFVFVVGATHYALASLFAFVILVPLSFYLHKKVTFPTSGPLPAMRFVLYTAQWTVMLFVNILLLALFVDLLHVNVNLAIVLVAVIIHLLSYAYTRGYVFHHKAPAK